MPKGKKKGKYDHKRTEQAYSSDEDAGIDMTNDNMSETSAASDLKSNHDEAENEIQEKLEEKVLETIDALSARSNAARATALTALRGALQRRNLSHILANHRATLADHVSRMLRRGKDGEKRAAASCASLLALQIGDEGAEEFLREVRPALAATVVDKTASLDTRTECCASLAALCVLLEDDLSEILDIMRIYETIFSGSYLKGDGTVKVSGAVVDEGNYHAAALDGWALMLSLLPPEHALSVLRTQPPGLPRLGQLLEACSLEVRMAAGTALAIAHEHATGDEPDEGLLQAASLLLPRLHQLSTESAKYRAKRGRKVQRAAFRDVLRYFEEDEVPTLTVRVGAESVTFDTWAARAVYSALAAALGAGLQALAPASPALRLALGLGDAPLAGTPNNKLNKRARHLQNNAADKARTLARNKNRDKRSAALAL